MPFPTDEERRRIAEMRRLMPTEAQQQMLEQMRHFAGLDNLAIAHEQIRLAIQGISGPGTEFYRTMQQFHQQMQEIAKQFIQPAINSQVMKLLVEQAEASQAVANKFYVENSIRLAQIAQAINQIQTTIPYETIANLRNTLFHVNDGPVRAAMETMRSLKLDDTSPVFTEFVTDVLQQPGPITKTTLKKVSKAHLSKKKISQLSVEQQFWIMFSTQLLALLIAWFQLVQTGQPIKLDPSQLKQLQQAPITITNVWQVMPSTPTHYLVERDCHMRRKPDTKSAIIAELSVGEKVERVDTNHKWVRVRYEDKKVTKEGWVNKKYLKRID